MPHTSSVYGGRRQLRLLLATSTALAAAFAAVPAPQTGPRTPAIAGRGGARAPAPLAAAAAAPSQSVSMAAEEERPLLGRNFTIVTTAALPWMTGTSVNPSLRAAHLTVLGYDVEFALPWIEVDDQEKIFPKSAGVFATPVDQEQWIREWMMAAVPDADMSMLRISWYPARYNEEFVSLLPIEDDMLAKEEMCGDIAILEEPEHLNWYHHGPRWTSRYHHVAGVLHTNYPEYAATKPAGELKGPYVEWVCGNCIAGHCDSVIRLSATLPKPPPGPHESVCNVHGVRDSFINIGAAHTAATLDATSGVYFLGKAVWPKGYSHIVDGYAKDATLPEIHVYGSGQHEGEIAEAIAAKRLGDRVVRFEGTDHAGPALRKYRVFFNPSISEVLCTATAEAVAMGKRVVVPDHPSNEFFKQFRNVRTYRTDAEMAEQLKYSVETAPIPLSDVAQNALSWEAATVRLLQTVEDSIHLSKRAAQRSPLPAGVRRRIASAIADGESESPDAAEEGVLRPSDTLPAQLAYRTQWATGVYPIGDGLRLLTGAKIDPRRSVDTARRRRAAVKSAFALGSAARVAATRQKKQRPTRPKDVAALDTLWRAALRRQSIAKPRAPVPPVSPGDGSAAAPRPDDVATPALAVDVTGQTEASAAVAKIVGKLTSMIESVQPIALVAFLPFLIGVGALEVITSRRPVDTSQADALAAANTRGVPDNDPAAVQAAAAAAPLEARGRAWRRRWWQLKSLVAPSFFTIVLPLAVGYTAVEALITFVVSSTAARGGASAAAAVVTGKAAAAAARVSPISAGLGSVAVWSRLRKSRGKQRAEQGEGGGGAEPPAAAPGL